MTAGLRAPIVAGAMLVLLTGAASLAHAQDDGSIVARIGDIEVALADLDAAWDTDDAADRIRLLMQLHDTRRRVLDSVIGEHLIEREALARGVTREELLAAELPARTLPVADDEIQLIYERNKDRFEGQSLEDMQPVIRTAIEQQRPTQALNQFMKDLQVAADDVVILLDPPRQRIETLAEDPSRGPVDAPVVIVEFSDFQCPFCQRANDTLEELFEQYGGQLRLVFKDFPLPRHTFAFKAAEAGNCAHEQGKFWEFHDRLFASRDTLDVTSLKTHASELGLDPDAFVTCLDEGRYADRVDRDLSIGRDYGASSTPTLFINGRPVFGAAPFEMFDDIIREELATAGR